MDMFQYYYDDMAELAQLERDEGERALKWAVTDFAEQVEKHGLLVCMDLLYTELRKNGYCNKTEEV